VRAHTLELHLDSAVLWRELDRVLQQIPDDLLEPPRVAADQKPGRVQHGLKPNVLGLGRVTDRFQSVLDQVAEIDRLDHEA
jgi:hypothetical protein